MDLEDLESPTSTSSCCARALSDSGTEADGPKLVQSRLQINEAICAGSALSPGSSFSEAFEGFSLLPSRLNSLGDEALSALLEDEDVPELTVDSIHKFIGSSRYHTAGGVPRPKILAQVSGTGLAPWEIHRPQKFVRDLVLRRCFSGRVLDAGCGIGDNALYVAKACPGAKVTAVDVVPRCLEFAAAKANLRNMRNQLDLVVADLLENDSGCLPPALGPNSTGSFDVVLDSSTFHCFSDAHRDRYVSTLRRLLRPGGLIYMNCMSEEETRPGGPRRITIADLRSVFCTANGWEVDGVEDSVVESHPTFWAGKAKARLFTIRKI
ncbi:hypothetical protein VOLCADRAFT_97821 [Volvox carteri f. nagariensis]|uniref:Methyltransferase domain-containing protein n=1 Tax=Volvox carteri f. nagariensis TaxID=3068 RepID=D8UDQ4_VOLCA|nr:uncharacterized protein VOLCADRAFT_97821 [Volvox carteri f. nagariensis]EFJ42084.1 hypothetical protein VOLCADRAFT_97821 [Volvox carteri f. nagariensis]|eukprot:XP_002956781.1 hypothetical protein VOLCADRAFT_97821 [Volvox carteri f. nagariensis]